LAVVRTTGCVYKVSVAFRGNGWTLPKTFVPYNLALPAFRAIDMGGWKGRQKGHLCFEGSRGGGGWAGDLTSEKWWS
jgi:hypothetical protein